ncbi:MAG: EboA domain-containing protein [Planctomycetota bacterium]
MSERLEDVDSWLSAELARAADERQAAWADQRVRELAEGGVDDDGFARTLSLASRFAPRAPLAPSADAVDAAGALVGGWNPERWSVLEALRVRLVVARARGDAETLPAAIEEAFRYADEGELRALYRSLQFLPGPERFIWRAGEGCRTNMKSVFEADTCDTGFPVRHLDDVAWRQLCIKALFVEAPLWRVFGFDERVDSELARMALDLADERRSAGRSVYPELWMCLGFEPSDRALESIERELGGDDELSRRGAILALGRLGRTDRLEEIERDGGSLFGPTARWALLGRHDQAAYRAVSIPEGAAPTTHASEAGTPEAAD